MKKFKTYSDEEKTNIILEVLRQGLMEIRYLSWHGNGKQAGDLTDALHNLPAMLINRNFYGSEAIIRHLRDYQDKYHGRDYPAKFDYLGYIKKSRF
jgi:hypothetical protein